MLLSPTIDPGRVTYPDRGEEGVGVVAGYELRAVAGIIDSMGIMELVMFVGDTFRITVEDEELVPDNFDSVSRLASYIRLKAPLEAYRS